MHLIPPADKDARQPILLSKNPTWKTKTVISLRSTKSRSADFRAAAYSLHLWYITCMWLLYIRPRHADPYQNVNEFTDVVVAFICSPFFSTGYSTGGHGHRDKKWLSDELSFYGENKHSVNSLIYTTICAERHRRTEHPKDLLSLLCPLLHQLLFCSLAFLNQSTQSQDVHLWENLQMKPKVELSRRRIKECKGGNNYK